MGLKVCLSLFSSFFSQVVFGRTRMVVGVGKRDVYGFPAFFFVASEFVLSSRNEVV